MLDLLFTGWGAFWMTLFMLLPFAIMFFYVIYRKSAVETGLAQTEARKFSRVEGYWLTFAFVVFVGVNLASLKYMPLIATAHAATTRTDIQQIDLTATSWSYDMSGREVEVGQTGALLGPKQRHDARLCRLPPERPGAVHDDADAGLEQTHLAHPYLHRGGHVHGSLPRVLRHRAPHHA